jgi:serine/threonine protein kinase
LLAIKESIPKTKEDMYNQMREAAILCENRNNHLVQFKTNFVENNRVFIVMEYCDRK